MALAEGVLSLFPITVSLAVIPLAGHAKVGGGEIGLQLLISTLDHFVVPP